MASLFVFRGNDQGQRIELPKTPVRLGRDASNTIRLHDTEVTRQHAEIRIEEGNYMLSDLNSRNGTFVNNIRIRRRKLSSGDHIAMGGTILLFTLSSAEMGENEEDLSETIRIASRRPKEEPSRIIHTMPQPSADDSRIFDFEMGSDQMSQQARSTLHVMYRTALAVSRTQNIDQLLDRIMDLVFEWIDADRGCIMLLNPTTQTFQPKVRRIRDGIPPDQRIIISKTILDYVAARAEGVLTTDASRDQRWDAAASIVHAGIREAICVPMQGRYDLVGVIYVDTWSSPSETLDRPGGRFTQDHLKLMVAIGYQAALAIEDTRHYSAMVQAERLAAIGQTVAALSHYIKNILQGIEGGSYLIETGLAQHNEGVVTKGWEIVAKNQKRISALVLDMLTLSKERDPDLRQNDLAQVVGEVVELLQARATEADIDLLWQPDPDIEPFLFDAEGIHRATLNVLTNAIDAVTEYFAQDDESDLIETEVSDDDFPEDGLFGVDAAEDSGINLTTQGQAESRPETSPLSTEANRFEAAKAEDDQEEDDQEEDDSAVIHDIEASLKSINESARKPAGDETQDDDNEANGNLDKERGCVIVTLRRLAGTSTIQIVVEDNGPGIPPERIQEVFSPFITTKKQGTGLGLHVSQKILREHQGRIYVEKSTRHGAIFILEFPIAHD